MGGICLSTLILTCWAHQSFLSVSEIPLGWLAFGHLKSLGSFRGWPLPLCGLPNSRGTFPSWHWTCILPSWVSSCNVSVFGTSCLSLKCVWQLSCSLLAYRLRNLHWLAYLVSEHFGDEPLIRGPCIFQPKMHYLVTTVFGSTQNIHPRNSH